MTCLRHPRSLESTRQRRLWRVICTHSIIHYYYLYKFYPFRGHFSKKLCTNFRHEPFSKSVASLAYNWGAAADVQEQKRPYGRINSLLLGDTLKLYHYNMPTNFVISYIALSYLPISMPHLFLPQRDYHIIFFHAFSVTASFTTLKSNEGTHLAQPKFDTSTSCSHSHTKLIP